MGYLGQAWRCLMKPRGFQMTISQTPVTVGYNRAAHQSPAGLPGAQTKMNSSSKQ